MADHTGSIVLWRDSRNQKIYRVNPSATIKVWVVTTTILNVDKFLTGSTIVHDANASHLHAWLDSIPTST